MAVRRCAQSGASPDAGHAVHLHSHGATVDILRGTLADAACAVASHPMGRVPPSGWLLRSRPMSSDCSCLGTGVPPYTVCSCEVQQMQSPPPRRGSSLAPAPAAREESR